MSKPVTGYSMTSQCKDEKLAILTLFFADMQALSSAQKVRDCIVKYGGIVFEMEDLEQENGYFANYDALSDAPVLPEIKIPENSFIKFSINGKSS